MGIKRQSPGKWQVFSETGVGNGYMLYTYTPGTTDNKLTYQDKDGAVNNTNPVVFDARGEADIWFDGIYDLRLTDENDVLIWTLSDFGAGEGQVNYGNYNLITDGGFEDDSNGDSLPDQWDVTAYPDGGSGAGVVIIDSIDQQEGSQSLKFTSVGDGGGYATSNFFNVREGGEVACQWAMKSTVADVRNVVELIWYTAAQVQISTSSLYDDSTTNPTGWTVKNGTATAVTNARYAKIRIIGCHSSDATSGATWFDDMKAVSDTIFGNLTIVNDLTVGGDLTVNGPFTSLGIDDNADSNAITIGADESVTIAVPTSAVALTVNGTDNAYTERTIGGPTAGQSFGKEVLAGTNASDINLLLKDQTDATNFLIVYGDGSGVAGAPAGGASGSVGVWNFAGLEIGGVPVTADQQLTDIAALATTDGGFIVGNGSTFVLETGATARASIGIDGATGVITEGDIDWANAGALSQCVIDGPGAITTTTAGLAYETRVLYVSGDCSSIEYYAELEGTGPNNINFRIASGALGTNGTTLQRSATGRDVHIGAGTLDVSGASSGWLTLSFEAWVTSSGTGYVHSISFRLI